MININMVYANDTDLLEAPLTRTWATKTRIAHIKTSSAGSVCWFAVGLHSYQKHRLEY